MRGEGDWLTYYSELRQDKEDLEKRFVSLVFRPTAAASAIVTIMLAIREAFPKRCSPSGMWDIGARVYWWRYCASWG